MAHAPGADPRQPTALPYPVAPLPTTGARTGAQILPLARPLTNYVSLTRNVSGRWCATLHKNKERTPIGMNGYQSADACYRELLALARMHDWHILLTRDFLDDLLCDWDRFDKEAQATPQQWELP